jgi:hypothetical protein
MLCPEKTAILYLFPRQLAAQERGRSSGLSQCAVKLRRNMLCMSMTVFFFYETYHMHDGMSPGEWSGPSSNCLPARSNMLNLGFRPLDWALSRLGWFCYANCYFFACDFSKISRKTPTFAKVIVPMFLSQFAWKIHEILYAAPCGINFRTAWKNYMLAQAHSFPRICRPGSYVGPV